MDVYKWANYLVENAHKWLSITTNNLGQTIIELSDRQKLFIDGNSDTDNVIRTIDTWYDIVNKRAV